MFRNACRTCRTIISVLLTNNITAFWCCRCRKAGLHGTICQPDLLARRRRSANLACILTADERPIHGNEYRSNFETSCNIAGFCNQMNTKCT